MREGKCLLDYTQFFDVYTLCKHFYLRDNRTVKCRNIFLFLFCKDCSPSYVPRKNSSPSFHLPLVTKSSLNNYIALYLDDINLKSPICHLILKANVSIFSVELHLQRLLQEVSAPTESNSSVISRIKYLKPCQVLQMNNPLCSHRTSSERFTQNTEYTLKNVFQPRPQQCLTQVRGLIGQQQVQFLFQHEVSKPQK